MILLWVFQKISGELPQKWTQTVIHNTTLFHFLHDISSIYTAAVKHHMGDINEKLTKMSQYGPTIRKCYYLQTQVITKKY